MNGKGEQKRDQFYKHLFLHNTLAPFNISFPCIKASVFHAFPMKRDLHLGEVSSGSCEVNIFWILMGC